MPPLLRFDLLPVGLRNRELREAVAPLRGMSLDDYNAGQMTYDLRRLRLRGLTERIPHRQRYRLTAEGLCIALAYHRTQARVLGPGRARSLPVLNGRGGAFDACRLIFLSVNALGGRKDDRRVRVGLVLIGAVLDQGRDQLVDGRAEVVRGFHHQVAPQFGQFCTAWTHPGCRRRQSRPSQSGFEQATCTSGASHQNLWVDGLEFAPRIVD